VLKLRQFVLCILIAFAFVGCDALKSLGNDESEETEEKKSKKKKKKKDVNKQSGFSRRLCRWRGRRGQMEGKVVSRYDPEEKG
jgi:hypothetical protein